MFEFLPAIVTLVALWQVGSQAGTRQGRNWFVRNLLSGVIACIAAFVVFFAMLSGGFAAVVGFVITLATTVVAWTTRAEHRAAPQRDAASPPTRAATPDEIEAAEAARVRSLAAMKAATAARKADQAKGSALPKPQEPQHLPATIRFRYMDRDGDVTVRTVDARAATTDGLNDYIEGICRQSGRPRSFRVDRIISHIIVMDTSEVFDAKAWFDAVPDKGFAEFDLPESRARREWKTAVMFVGFRDARRHELESIADAAGWQVRQRFSETLNVVVAGSLAGQNQLDKAAGCGAEVISEDDFRARV